MTRLTNDKGQFVRQAPEERFWEKVDKDGPVPAHVPEIGNCWTWTGPKRGNGYGYTTDYWRKILAHRFAYELTKGPIPEGLNVCHACDNRSCVRPDHLWVGTHRDNNRDAFSKGRQPARVANPLRGEASPQSVLTENDVRMIRAAYQPGSGRGGKRITLRFLAEQYGVSTPLIHAIVQRKAWPHVD